MLRCGGMGALRRPPKHPPRRMLLPAGPFFALSTGATSPARPLPPVGAANSIRDHLLTSYVVSFAAVLGSQFGSKSFAGGREGVLRLIQHSSGEDTCSGWQLAVAF